MSLVKTNVPGFSKDMETNVIVNTDMSKYKSIKESRKKAKELDNLKEAVSSLQGDIALILNALGIKK